MPAHQAALEQHAGARHRWVHWARCLPTEPTVDHRPRDRRVYTSTLKPRLEALEAMRQALRGYVVKAGLCLGVPLALFFLSDILGGLAPSVGAGPIRGGQLRVDPCRRRRCRPDVSASRCQRLHELSDPLQARGGGRGVQNRLPYRRGTWPRTGRGRGGLRRGGHLQPARRLCRGRPRPRHHRPHGLRGRRRHPLLPHQQRQEQRPDGDRVPRAVLPSRLQQAAEQPTIVQPANEIGDHRRQPRGFQSRHSRKCGLRRRVRGVCHRRGRGPLPPHRGDDRADPVVGGAHRKADLSRVARARAPISGCTTGGPCSSRGSPRRRR